MNPKGKDICIRKVKVLGFRARAECDRQGLDDNDLVEVETIIKAGTIPQYVINKIEGSPMDWLDKKYLNRDPK